MPVVTEDGVTHLSVDEAVEAARAAAFTVEACCTDPACTNRSSDAGRTLLHCFMSFTGADWDIDGVVALIERSDDRGWLPHLIDHELAVVADGRVHRFDVRAPAGTFDAIGGGVNNEGANNG